MLMKTEIGTIDYHELYEMEAESLSKDRMIALWDDREAQLELEMIEEAIEEAIKHDRPEKAEALKAKNPQFFHCSIPENNGLDEF